MPASTVLAASVSVTSDAPSGGLVLSVSSIPTDIFTMEEEAERYLGILNKNL